MLLKAASQKIWRSRVSIPVPPACKAGALPFELHPHVSVISSALQKPILTILKSKRAEGGFEPLGR